MPTDNQTTFELETSTITAGDTATASVIEVRLFKLLKGRKEPIGRQVGLKAHLCLVDTHTNSTNGVLAPVTGYGTTRDTHTANKELTLDSPAAGVAASSDLTISGVVIDGETFVINGRTYYFSTGLTSVPTGNVSVDISADGTKSQGTLSMATKPTANDTVTLGTKTYTFKATAVVDGDVEIGAAVANSQTNLVAAINGTDSLNTANTQVSAAAFATDASVITALYTGTQGDSIVSTETFTDVTDAFDAATLGTTTAGVDVAATDAGDAVDVAIAADGGAVVTSSNSAGTVTCTGISTGAFMNAYTTTEAMANGAWDGATLSGGIEDDVSTFRLSLTNATASEGMTLRFGEADIGGVPCDYTKTVAVTHVAP